jgi:hypothetical protein
MDKGMLVMRAREGGHGDRRIGAFEAVARAKFCVSDAQGKAVGEAMHVAVAVPGCNSALVLLEAQLDDVAVRE